MKGLDFVLQTVPLALQVFVVALEVFYLHAKRIVLGCEMPDLVLKAVAVHRSDALTLLGRRLPGRHRDHIGALMNVHVHAPGHQRDGRHQDGRRPHDPTSHVLPPPRTLTPRID